MYVHESIALIDARIEYKKWLKGRIYVEEWKGGLERGWIYFRIDAKGNEICLSISVAEKEFTCVQAWKVINIHIWVVVVNEDICPRCAVAHL